MLKCAGSGNVTNSTACIDGYMNGWKHWCNHNAKDCAGLTTSDLFPGSLLSDNNTALANAKSLSYIVGTWNFVNVSKTSNESESVGTLKLKNDGTAVEIGKYGQIIHGMVVCYNGKCGHDPTSSGSWYYDGEKLELSYIGGPGVWFTVIKTSPTHIELTDDKGDTIHLMRGGTALKILSPVIAHTTTNESPYQSGYDHGLSDARQVNGTYYMQQTGGFNGHSEKFNDGYIAGWCSVQGKDASSDDDAYTFHCDTDVKNHN